MSGLESYFRTKYYHNLVQEYRPAPSPSFIFSLIDSPYSEGLDRIFQEKKPGTLLTDR
jgi:hypothetical protein